MRLAHLVDTSGRPVEHRDIAAAFGWRRSRLADYVAGRRVLSLDRALALARLLGCGVEELSAVDPVAVDRWARSIRAERGWSVAPTYLPRELPRPGAGADARWQSFREIRERAPESLAILGLIVHLSAGAREPVMLDLLHVADALGVTLGAVERALAALGGLGLRCAAAGRVRGVFAVGLDWARFAPRSISIEVPRQTVPLEAASSDVEAVATRRVVAVSPGTRSTGVASYVDDARGSALRSFAVVGHTDASAAGPRMRLLRALADVIARERATALILEDPIRARQTRGVTVAMEVVRKAADAARIPLQCVGLRDAVRAVCGVLRPAGLRTASEVIAQLFPHVAGRLPSAHRSAAWPGRRSYWAPAWAAAVLGWAAIDATPPKTSAAK